MQTEQIHLTVEQAISVAQESAYWDGLVAGVKLAADHAKQLTLKGIAESRKVQQAPQPQSDTPPIKTRKEK